MELFGKELRFNKNKVYHTGDKPTPSEIGAAPTSHNHGLLHDSFGITVADTTTDNGWSMINSSYNGFLLKSLHSGFKAPAWLQENYSAGIAFGGSDTKGVMSVSYYTPSVRFAGGNGDKPVWHFTVNGSSGETYNMDSLAANTANTLATTRTINGTSFNGSANITTANWGTARTLTIGSTGKSVNGSGNVSWTWSEMQVPRAYSSSYNFGGNQDAITTAQFITILTNLGAFSQVYWVSRGSWSYATNQYINDTGCGNIHLAGCVVEVIGNTLAYTIRVTTPTTTESGTTNAEFIYVNNGSGYAPGWRRQYNTKNKPTPSEIGAFPVAGGTMYGNLTIDTSQGGITVGTGDSDIFLHNRTSDKYLQLKNDGSLKYNNNAVYHAGQPQPNRGYKAECQSNKGLHATVDLSNLNSNTYYPVVGTALNADAGYVDIRVSVNLNSGTKPSWSTHNNGFTCQFHVLMKPCGWGMNNAESIILDNTYRWANQNPVGYIQMNNASMPCLYLRGGGRYYIYSGEPITWSVKTSSYTASENTVSPTTSYPGVYVQRSQIQANLYGDVQCPSKWIKLGSRWLTIDSTAPSASVGDVWIQV